MTHFN